MENQIYPPELKAILQEAFNGVGILCTEENKGENGGLAKFLTAIYINNTCKLFNSVGDYYGMDNDSRLENWSTTANFSKGLLTLKKAIKKRDAIVSEYYAKESKTEIKKFKALMHDGKFVDYQLLWSRIKYCDIPFLFSENHNIETLVNETSFNLRFMSKESLSQLSENLEKCELVEVKLTIKTK